MLQKQELETDAVVRNILGGTEEIVCHHGTHQYGYRGISGVSACGLAALNFARIIFAKARECRRDEDLLRAVIAKETVQVSLLIFYAFVACSSERPSIAQDITDICTEWRSDLHLEVEDICQVPLFDKTLKLVSTKYGQPAVDHFTTLLQ
jgi:hypothetical protein